MNTDFTMIEREQQVMFQVYRRQPLVIQRGDGCYLYDSESRQFLDFLSGIAVNALGYNYPKLNDAIIRQLYSFIHVSNVFYQEPQIRLAELLTQITGFDRIFFSNSGTEALEGALKLAKRWGNQIGKSEIVAFKGGFHGRTYGALSIMDKPLYKEQMGPFLPNVHVIPYNNRELLQQTISDSTCAVVMEFIQGEGGIVMANPDFVHDLHVLQKKYNFLVIADEIQAGVGRTGKFFGFEHYSIKPDIVLMAKALGGGLPLGAILGSEKVANVWDKGMHGTTFGGNPVACAAGLVVLQDVVGELQQNAQETGLYLRENLEILQSEFPGIIQEVRGCGFMCGLNLHVPAAPFVEKMLRRGVIINATADTVIRILPPLIAKRLEVDVFATALRDSMLE